MGLYRREGTQVWWCRFQVAGKEFKRSTRSTSRRAAEVEMRRLRAICEAKAPDRSPKGRITMAYLAGIDAERAESNGATEHHLKVLEWRWGNICKFFGADSDPSACITYDAVQKYITYRRSQGAKDTIRRELGDMRRASKEARRRGMLAFALEDWPEFRGTGKGTIRKGRLHPPHVLAQWLACLHQDARDEATVALLTGLRASELKRIEASWLELGDVPVMRVPSAAAKSRNERVVPLTPMALETLKRRASQTPDGHRIMPQANHKTAFRLARERIGYNVPISLRDLRHTWGTLANRHAGLDAARDGLGHSNISMTSAYISGDLRRVATASMRLEESLVGTVKSAQVSKTASRERVTGFEPATLSLEGQLPDLLSHVSSCKHCLERAASCSKMHVIDDDAGTGKSAQGVNQ